MFGLTITDRRRIAYDLAEKNHVIHRFNNEKRMAGKNGSMVDTIFNVNESGWFQHRPEKDAKGCLLQRQKTSRWDH
jgi:hypothetical protein